MIATCRDYPWTRLVAFIALVLAVVAVYAIYKYYENKGDR